MTPRIFARRFAVIALALALAGSATALAAAPTGDHGSIAFYRQVAAAYSRVGSLTASRHGYLTYTVAGSSFRYQQGERPPAGYRPASERIVAILRNGRTVAYVDHAHARGLPTLTIFEDSTGVWASIGGCSYKNPRSSGVLGWGHAFVGLAGNFSPLERSGKVVIVRSTYPWGKTGQAAEVDRFSAATKYWQSYSARVTGGTGAFTFGMNGFKESAARPTLSSAPHC